MLLAGLVSMVWTGVSFGEVRTGGCSLLKWNDSQGKEIIRCRSCGNIIGSGPVAGDPIPILDPFVVGPSSEKVKGFDLISPGQVEGFYNILLAKGIEKDPLQLMKSHGSSNESGLCALGYMCSGTRKE